MDTKQLERDVISLLKASLLPIPKADMFHLLGADTESKQRMVRHVISLINDIPVGSCDKGYFLVRTKADLELANAEDLSRIEAFDKKIEARKYAFANWETKKIVDNWREIPVPSFLKKVIA